MAMHTNAEGNFFVQTKRSEPFSLLSCTSLGDIDIPEGDQTPVYCPDPLNSGKFKIEGYIRGVPGMGTYTITKPLAGVLNWLMEQKCAFQGRVNITCRGQRQDPNNFDVSVLMHNCSTSRKRITAPVIADPQAETEARVNTNADVNFQALAVLYKVNIARQTVVNTVAGNFIYFLPQRCEDHCGAGRDLCEVGVIGLDGGGGYLYESEVKKTTNGGSTWAATTTDPFTFGGTILAGLMLETTAGYKIIVFRGSAVAGAPAEVGISEDGGVTWSNYFVGSINGQYITSYTFLGANIIVTASGGYIYKSADFGVTWSAQESGTETTETLNAIAFYDDNKGYVVGNNNAFEYTDNAGGDWVLGTGPEPGVNLISLAINDKGHVFVGTNSGHVWVSEDEGVTWVSRVDFGGGSVNWIAFDAEMRYIGALLYNTATPVGHLYRSLDGGATWQIETTPANSGLNGGYICDPNHIAIVGEPHNGTTFIAMTMPA